MSYPRVLQIEPTNKCNLNCIMCVRNTWHNEQLRDLDYKTYTRLIDESVNRLKRIALYGFGEPLVNHRFENMVSYARTILGDSVKILTVTNGTMFVEDRARKILDAGIDEIAFSIETFDKLKLYRIRIGAENYDVLTNLRELLRLKKEYDVRVGIATVIMRSNYKELPKMVLEAANMGVDFIVFSHLVPYYESMVSEMAYTLASKQAIMMIEKLGVEVEDLGRKAVYDVLSQIYSGRSTGAKVQYLLLWKKLSEKNYSINPDIVKDVLQKKRFLNDVEKTLEEARKIAKEKGIEARIPSVYADANNRSCPYINEDAAMVTAAGDVVPCMDFAYAHPLYVNGHVKWIKKIVFGNLREKNMEEIWNSQRFVEFRKVRKNMSKTIPWCADCPFSTRYCWYVQDNSYDCYGNETGCNECIYSAGLAHCII
ncbi:MAG: radical SAM protein [Thermoprotei archaeon]|nr:MAG: radical SAM protein [Thermoprotei archaeon]